MAKINYSKAEEAIYASVYQKAVYEMLEEATLANLTAGIQPSSQENASQDLSEKETQAILQEKVKTDKIIDQMLARFREKMTHLKNKHPEFYQQLDISSEEEQRFLAKPEEFTRNDWVKLKIVKNKIAEYESLAKTQAPSLGTNKEDLSQIESQKKEHLHKRYNVKKGWMPL